MSSLARGDVEACREARSCAREELEVAVVVSHSARVCICDRGAAFDVSRPSLLLLKREVCDAKGAAGTDTGSCVRAECRGGALVACLRCCMVGMCVLSRHLPRASDVRRSQS